MTCPGSNPTGRQDVRYRHATAAEEGGLPSQCSAPRTDSSILSEIDV